MPKINIENAKSMIGSGYPHPFELPCQMRQNLALGDAGGLTQFGVNVLTLPASTPDLESWASQRHWHSAEDEFIYVLSGSCLLIDDCGETKLSAGDACTHKAGDGNGHHIINNSGDVVTLLVVGTRQPENDHCHYPDIDLDLPSIGRPGRIYCHKDGQAYPKTK